MRAWNHSPGREDSSGTERIFWGQGLSGAWGPGIEWSVRPFSWGQGLSGAWGMLGRRKNIRVVFWPSAWFVQVPIRNFFYKILFSLLHIPNAHPQKEKARDDARKMVAIIRENLAKEKGKVVYKLYSTLSQTGSMHCHRDSIGTSRQIRRNVLRVSTHCQLSADSHQQIVDNAWRHAR